MCYKIFILSDVRKKTSSLKAFLSNYDNYELHFIPAEMNLLDVLNLEPDIVVMDSEAKKVLKCYEWKEVA